MKNVGERQLFSSKPTFLADAMLGSVARKLRIFGFDTLYIRHICDDDVLRIATEQNRIVLTCDKELFRRVVKVGGRGVLLEGSNDSQHIIHTLSKYGVSSVTFDSLNSRCSVCNGIMIRKKPDDVKKYIPSNTIKWQKKFFQCQNCYKIYWEGSHLIRIRSLALNLNAKIKEEVKEALSKASM